MPLRPPQPRGAARTVPPGADPGRPEPALTAEPGEEADAEQQGHGCGRPRHPQAERGMAGRSGAAPGRAGPGGAVRGAAALAAAGPGWAGGAAPVPLRRRLRHRRRPLGRPGLPAPGSAQRQAPRSPHTEPRGARTRRTGLAGGGSGQAAAGEPPARALPSSLPGPPHSPAWAPRPGPPPGSCHQLPRPQLSAPRRRRPLSSRAAPGPEAGPCPGTSPHQPAPPRAAAPGGRLLQTKQQSRGRRRGAQGHRHRHRPGSPGRPWQAAGAGAGGTGGARSREGDCPGNALVGTTRSRHRPAAPAVRPGAAPGRRELGTGPSPAPGWRLRPRAPRALAPPPGSGPAPRGQHQGDARPSGTSGSPSNGARRRPSPSGPAVGRHVRAL